MYEPSLKNVLVQDTLKWIFVGGKGGVGKTTTSCSLAVQLSKVRERVLIISTDPAHNLSDAFDQKFGKDPTLVHGFDNLFAMEIDPTAKMEEMIKGDKYILYYILADGAANQGPLGNLLGDLSLSVPGIDEAMNFATVMQLVKSMDYSVIVFDTAPTGHTLRFLSFPDAIEKGLKKLSELGGSFGPMIQQMTGLLGGGQSNPNMVNDMMSKMDEMRKTVNEVNSQFRDPSKTTFICVLIAEFLSLYETERMIQELCNYEIDVHNVVVNQLLFPKPSSHCEHCDARRKMQQKYLSQINELYDTFHVVKMPLLTCEIRGVHDIESFSKYLIEPFNKE